MCAVRYTAVDDDTVVAVVLMHERMPREQLVDLLVRQYGGT